MLDRAKIDLMGEPSLGEAGAAAYLSRCQVDTPAPIVRLVWELVNRARPNAGAVADFGCGDARFASEGVYQSYTGFEIDPRRAPTKANGADVRVECAFAAKNTRSQYSTCIGNPPYVRHHDLGTAWLARAERRLEEIEGYSADGRSNAYVYFMWLALDCVEPKGLVALVVPYEWVSRPASAKLRKYIESNGWRVDVYYLPKAGFDRVLTTACITVIDKSPEAGGGWHWHEMNADGSGARRRNQITRTNHRRLAYERADTHTYAMRGLSPGGQDDFVLTEELRIRHRLVVGRDVVPAVTSFRHFTTAQATLTERLFREQFVNNGKRCWLICPQGEPHASLKAYLERIPKATRENYTCRTRNVWWRFDVPEVPDILYASGFKSKAPKMFRNEIGAVHVGAIHGIYCKPKSQTSTLLARLQDFDFASKVVPLSNGFLKIEVNQMNAVLNQLQA